MRRFSTFFSCVMAVICVSMVAWRTKPPSSLRLESPDGKHSIVLQCTNDGSMIRVDGNEGCDPRYGWVAIMTNRNYGGPFVGVNGDRFDGKHEACDVAIAANSRDGGMVQIIDRNLKGDRRFSFLEAHDWKWPSAKSSK